MEQILYKASETPKTHLEKYNILTDCQHGFRQGRSCETQRLTTLEDYALTWTWPAVKRTSLYKIFQKLSYCPPSVPTRDARSTMGLEETSFNSWIASWLKQRNKRVVLNGKYSKPTKVLSGVPQESVYWLPFSPCCLSMTLFTKISVLSFFFRLLVTTYLED